ncbi:MAG: GTPase, partial [Acidobacteriota bacterium]
MARQKVIIIGAAGRDFHNFNTVYRGNPDYQVVAFTATQIPDIEGRRYPAALSGKLYPDGIPIHPMQELEDLIRRHRAQLCVFSYSDIHYVDLMQVANRVLSSGADFQLLAPARGHLESSKPVISVLA